MFMGVRNSLLRRIVTVHSPVWSMISNGEPPIGSIDIGPGGAANESPAGCKATGSAEMDRLSPGAA